MTSRRSPGCRSRLARLFDYIDGELSPSRVRALESHLDQCACCAELQRDLRRVVLATRAAGDTRLPAAVRRRAQARIRRLLNARTR